MKLANFLALCYADIFSYPLKKEELEYWSINPTSLQIKKTAEIKNDSYQEKKYYYLISREQIISRRLDCQRYSEKKLTLAKKISSYLQLIPGIKMIAVTGALAMENSQLEDDIDLLIVTEKNRVWLTRIIALLILSVIGKRRKPDEKKFRDKICLNMILDPSVLGVKKNKQNLYVAHEVLQAKCIYNTENTYEKFISYNKWVRRYLPVAYKKIQVKLNTVLPKKDERPSFYSSILNIMDTIFFVLQKKYMQARMTRETADKHQILFHPRDTNTIVNQEFQLRLKKYLLLV